MSAPEFVAIGHVTLDRFGDVVRPGGAALYAAVTADRLGLSAGILTSHADDFPLELLPPRIELVSVPAVETTVFEHDNAGGERRLRVRATAQPLGLEDLPEDWRDPELVLLAPVVNEVDGALVGAFEGATLAAEAQGWLRTVARDGAVQTRAWASPKGVLSRLQALFLSGADVRGQEAAMTEWVQRVPVAAVTAGARGALLYVNGDRYEVRPRRARQIDATGAGDVFAATWLVRYRMSGDPWEAAEAATCSASLAVEAEGWAGVPDAAALDAALKDYRRAA
ncbi:MAG TPA: PfkB family carbohydrate kinase [Methylomirabilota bacterium]